jgi:hypothetical protein
LTLNNDELTKKLQLTEKEDSLILSQEDNEIYYKQQLVQSVQDVDEMSKHLHESMNKNEDLITEIAVL